jgi:hypothetical protein
MCMDASPSPPTGKPQDPGEPTRASDPRLLSRRTWLTLGAGGVGAILGLWSCNGPESSPAPPLATRAGAATPQTAPVAVLPAPATTRAAVETAPAQVAATSRAPDLGCELFPDVNNRPLAQASDAPVIVIPRSSWTHSSPNLSEIAVMNGVDKITIHHTAGAMLTDAWNPTAGELEHIREFHAGTRAADRNWADIAYHFVVDRAGRVWQARPLAYQGAHVRGHNEHNLGIVLLGNFEVQSPSAAQLWSLAGFISFLRPLYRIPLSRLYTHGELGQTECPGKMLQAYMNRTRQAWAAAEGTSWTRPTT